MSDIYDEIAQKAANAERLCVPFADQIAYAKAFREHFARRTCASCRHWGTLTSGQLAKEGRRYCEHPAFPTLCEEAIPLATFSCSLWTAKPEANQ